MAFTAISRFAGAALVAAAGLAAAPATAATYTYNLTGNIADGTFFAPFTIGGLTYTIYNLDLGDVTPVDLAVGDIIDVTVTLDGLLTVPSSSAFTFAGINARTTPAELASPPPGGGVTSSSVFTPNGGDYDGTPFFGACGNCIAASLFLPGPVASFTIGGGQGIITIENLIALDPTYSGPISLTGFSFGYQATDTAFAPVPEPASWALMIVGMGAIGGLLRRRARYAPALRRTRTA